MAKYRIGIDLGTSNCALAAIPLDGETAFPEVMPIPQPESAQTRSEHATLPSCLYHPLEGETAHPDLSGWIAGRWARNKLAETPDWVVASAKSWFIHHAADRRADFLPLGGGGARLSPVNAQTLLLRWLAGAWDAAHPDALLQAQSVVITVPASFDPAAQALTLEAARAAGFPADLRLIEEPQAAFYNWLNTDSGEGLAALLADGGKRHVLVVDIGGGTTDLSLFAVSAAEAGAHVPRLERIAVSDHLLLGGDNLDLALAHQLEEQLAPEAGLDARTFAALVEQARAVKEAALSGEPSAEAELPVAVAKAGASLLSGTLRTGISAEAVRERLLDGFFPKVLRDEIPEATPVGLREMGLPYARDPAITRHLAAFLRGRPSVDAVLFNGGVTSAPTIRQRIVENITRWQEGRQPEVLAGAEPNLSVACGAAVYLSRVAGHAKRDEHQTVIEAGASHSYYLGTAEGRVICVLPQATPADEPVQIDLDQLRVQTRAPVAFPLFRHARRGNDSAGAVIAQDSDGLVELPALETSLKLPPGRPMPEDKRVGVNLGAQLTSTGLLRIALRGLEREGLKDLAWPLDFSLRGRGAGSSGGVVAAVLRGTLKEASSALRRTFFKGANKRQRLTANLVFSAGEKVLKAPRQEWTGGQARALFGPWWEIAEDRAKSPVHGEVWWQVAGYLLRPGRGVAGDAERVAVLVPLLATASKGEKNAVRIQRWIAARRIAPGLTADAATAIWAAVRGEWAETGAVPAELALLAGSLENLPVSEREAIAGRIVELILQQPNQVAYWKALGRVLSRVLLHGGVDDVLPPSLVAETWDRLRKVEIAESTRADATDAWLRAARLTGLRALDPERGPRRGIAKLLGKWGVSPVRLRVLETVVPLVAADAASMLGEQPPPGLSLLPK